MQIRLDSVNYVKPFVEEVEHQLAFIMTRTAYGLKTAVYDKPTFTGQYINLISRPPGLRLRHVEKKKRFRYNHRS